MKNQKSNVPNVDVNLHLDWCSFKAAKYACERWHYSKKVPTGKLAKIGVWENNQYIGCVLFGKSANNQLGTRYNLKHTEICELMRVALNRHITPVTRIISIAIKILKKEMSGLKMIVSYADPEWGHTGVIYKAGNWKYEGITKPVDYYKRSNGEILHWRNARFKQKKGEKLEKFFKPGKHKYIYSLRQ